MNSLPEERNGKSPDIISYYFLNYTKEKGDEFVRRHRVPPDEDRTQKTALLIDLNNACIPDDEMEKLVLGLAWPGMRILCIVFVHCHVHNQRKIKRALKAHNVALFCNTAFFADLAPAREWLAAQTANR